MRTEWTRLNETERGAFAVLMAFLNGRLASAETINWALQLGPSKSVKRAAVLQLVDSSEGRKLAEPWRTAWRMIEEYWNTPSLGHLADTKPNDIGRRVKSGDRSGSLLVTIADYVAPSLRVSALSQWPAKTRKSPKKPRTVSQLLSMGLTSAKVVDPHTMGLHEIEDDTFLGALANALESVLTRGLDAARRLGWDGERKLYQLGQLHRAYFVPAAERKAGEHEPDEFHKGIAPCVKLLHFVVDRLVKRRALAAHGIVARLKLTPSPFHARLWAALARDPWIASASEVSNFLNPLDDHRFWDVQNFPEIAELRAVRFQEFDAATQQALVTRLRKLPPRGEWPRGMDPVRLARARLYWGVRELRRIEIAGGILATKDKAWFMSEIVNFPELAQMKRLDDGFMGAPKATYVSPNPDTRYDELAGEGRLSALEAALGSARRGWDDDVSERAWDWMRQAGNAAALIPDLEASADGGAAFPRLSGTIRLGAFACCRNEWSETAATIDGRSHACPAPARQIARGDDLAGDRRHFAVDIDLAGLRRNVAGRSGGVAAPVAACGRIDQRRHSPPMRISISILSRARPTTTSPWISTRSTPPPENLSARFSQPVRRSKERRIRLAMTASRARCAIRLSPPRGSPD